MHVVDEKKCRDKGVGPFSEFALMKLVLSNVEVEVIIDVVS